VINEAHNHRLKVERFRLARIEWISTSLQPLDQAILVAHSLGSSSSLSNFGGENGLR